jgi:hypothetical protein
MCSRKLRHYFEAHTIRVLTNQPLHDIFGNRDSFGHIRNWATELSEYVINFKRRTTIKSQILADFMAEWTEPWSSRHCARIPLLVHYNGSWGSTGAGAAAILTSPSGIKLRYAARLQFAGKTNKCTNNIVEYEAILLGLRKLRVIGMQTCVLHTNSKVVSRQIEKECIAREPTLERYLALVRRMESYIKGFTV